MTPDIIRSLIFDLISLCTNPFVNGAQKECCTNIICMILALPWLLKLQCYMKIQLCNIVNKKCGFYSAHSFGFKQFLNK